MPSSFVWADRDREKLNFPENGWHGVELLQFSSVDNFTIAAGNQEYEGTTGSAHWRLLSFPSYDSLVLIHVITSATGYTWDDGTFEWIDASSNQQISVPAPWNIYYSMFRWVEDGEPIILPGAALNPGYDYDLGYGHIILRHTYGTTAELELFYHFDSTIYSEPDAAWLAGGLDVLFGQTFDKEATSRGGLQMILGILSFQSVPGIPYMISSIFGFFMWSLIAVIAVTLVSRFIPFI